MTTLYELIRCDICNKHFFNNKEIRLYLKSKNSKMKGIQFGELIQQHECKDCREKINERN